MNRLYVYGYLLRLYTNSLSSKLSSTTCTWRRCDKVQLRKFSKAYFLSSRRIRGMASSAKSAADNNVQTLTHMSSSVDPTSNAGPQTSDSSNSIPGTDLQACNVDIKHATLETLNFDNVALRELPVDTERENYLREVVGACFSRVDPTPVDNPRLVVASLPALKLIGLGEDEIARKEFVEYFSGNKILPGSDTAAHCYCGHQFGHFAGQLGDGAAIYLGEVVNSQGGRWEVQLKGAGLTPFSRQADGRKVLRSSIREFLCSEAMYHLGIPTTRAACCITSDTRVTRDMFYDGHPRVEQCTVVTRIAETFIRFGSFEVCKGPDSTTGREGPSCARPKVLQSLTDYVIKQFYSHIWAREHDSDQRYVSMFREVVERTAVLVARWQSVGFCHGVLNTDNMSIIGLTIDYGPFGFMDRYNPMHICNTSDDGGRYAYMKQPEVCRWNCHKLAEMLQKLVPMDQLYPELERFDEIYNKTYMSLMRRKLGLIQVQEESDRQLVDSLLDTMQRTGADFTNSFRCLSGVVPPSDHAHTQSVDQVLEYLVTQCATLEELKAAYQPRMDPRQYAMMTSLMESNPQLLMSLGLGYRLLAVEQRNAEKLKELEDKTEEDLIRDNRALWLEWLNKYTGRLQQETVNIQSDLITYNSTRQQVMNSTNPRIVLRNYIAQEAIDAAERGDFSVVRKVLELLQDPFKDHTTISDEQSTKAAGTEAVCRGSEDRTDAESSTISASKYCSKPPKSAACLRVSCSS